MSNIEGKTFGTAVGCMDGRGQEVVIDFVKKQFKVDYVDTITDAGIVKHIAHTHNQEYLDNIRIKIVDVSARKHNSRGIVVWGHNDCAGNPVDDDHHKADVLKAAERVSRMEPGVEVVPIFLTVAEPPEIEVLE